jgi:hypothetical protein
MCYLRTATPCRIACELCGDAGRDQAAHWSAATQGGMVLLYWDIENMMLDRQQQAGGGVNSVTYFQEPFGLLT